MAFWIATGFVCLVVVVLVFLAARRPAETVRPAAAFDLQVYRDQLTELDRDVARGTLSEEEAARARTEVSRRILEADRALQSGQKAEGVTRTGTAIIAIGLLLTIAGAFWTYLQIGAPGYPDLPLTQRIAMIEQARDNRPSQDLAEQQVPDLASPNADPERAAMVAQLRTLMETRPDDTEGLMLLAANEAMLGNFRAARRAQQRLITLLDSEATGRHYIDLAEMMIFAAGGYVSPEAEQALRTGLERTPRDGTGRYYAGEMFAQQGRPDLALPIWSNLLAESSPDAPWVPPIRAQIAEIAFVAGVELDPSLLAAPRGPSMAEMEALQGLDPSEQQAMIETMVEGLADRLGTEGGTPQDWAQLITAYGVLGRTNAAQIVHEEALSVFADAPDALEIIESAFRAAMARLDAP